MIEEHLNAELQEGLKHIEHIEETLKEIKERTSNPKRAFLNGFVQAIGWVIGTVAAIALIGWVLSLFGVIPGFAQLAQHLHTILDRLGAKA